MTGKNVNMLLKTSIYHFIIAALTIFFLSTSNAMAYEEPEYKLIKSTDVYEIRQYQDRLAVETTQSQSQNGAFRRLFNYISGSNESSSKIAMTVPVIQSKDSNGASMIFFLPKSFTKQSAPLPRWGRCKTDYRQGWFLRSHQIFRALHRSKLYQTLCPSF